MGGLNILSLLAIVIGVILACTGCTYLDRQNRRRGCTLNPETARQARLFIRIGVLLLWIGIAVFVWTGQELLAVLRR